MDIYKNSGKLLAVLITAFFLSTVFSASFTATGTKLSNYSTKTIENGKVSFDDYIIQFVDEPVSAFKNQFRVKIKEAFPDLAKIVVNSVFNQKIVQYKDKLLSAHKTAKEDILKLLGSDEASEKIFSRSFTGLFNGMSIKNVPDDVVEKIRNLPYVKSIAPNRKISACLHESVPIIGADDVWQLHDENGNSITGKGVKIAIMDTGVDYTHPDLKDNYKGGYDFVNNDADPMDDCVFSHGTHCAGIALGTGKTSDYTYVGVAPEAELYAYKILDHEGNGNELDYIAAMHQAVYEDDVDIISLSFGDNSTNANPDDNLSIVVDNAVAEGVVVVAAAGNEGNNERIVITSPGCARESICVGATDKYDNVASFSSTGPVEWNGSYIVKPDVVAPGVSITSTRKGGGYISMSGTSMATPHVAGAAALILQNKPELQGNPEEIKRILKDTAADLNYDVNTQGSGRIDVLNAINHDNELFINAPSEIFEKENFEINLSDKTGNPVNALVLFTAPFHLPRFKYGSTITFKAPTILMPYKDKVVGKIIVIKLFSEDKVWKKDIVIINKS